MLDTIALRTLAMSIAILEARFDRLHARHDDASFQEHQHPRGPDGKFTSGSGVPSSAAKGVESYNAGLGGKKGTTAGLIKHLLMLGDVPEKDIFKAAQAQFGLTEDKAGHVKWYHNDLKKKGVDVPSLVKGESTSPKAEEKKVGQEIAAKPAEKSGVSSAAKKIYQEHISDWQHSMMHGDEELTKSLDSVIDAMMTTDPAEKAAKIKALVPMSGMGASDHIDSVNELIGQLKVDHGEAPKSEAAPATTSGVPPVPEHLKGASFYTAQAAYAVAIGDAQPFAKLQALAKLEENASGSAKGANAYVNQLFKHVNDEFVAAGPTPIADPQVGPAHKLHPDNVKALAELEKHWTNVGEKLKPAVDAKHDELMNALQKPTEQAQKAAVAALTPIENPSGMGQKSMNEFLAKVKNDYGVAPQPTTNLPHGSPDPAQQKAAQAAVYAAVKAAPHKSINHINEYEDAHGNTVASRQIAKTKDILGDHYAKVTAAYGGSGNGMAEPVSKAMTAYWQDIDKTWSNDQKKSIYSYQDGGYGEINRYLLSGGTKSTHAKEKVEHMKKALETSFIPADTPVYRGLNCDLKALTGFDDPTQAIGRCFEHRNFASVSRNRQTSLGFGDNVLMKMTMPAGTPGLVVGGQSAGDGGNHHEKEIILGPRSMWRIDKYEKGGEGAQHLIHCTYLGERTDEMTDVSKEFEDN